MLKTGRKCTWEDIEVGEVFAWNGCWEVNVKINSNSSMVLSSNMFHNEGLIDVDFHSSSCVEIHYQTCLW